MGKQDHSRNQKEGKFCAVAATPCGCGNHYIDACNPHWDSSQFKFSFKQRGTNTKVTKVFEAHHVLCVASVGNIVVGNEDIRAIVRLTKWCVNNKDNMLAMPLWGNTVKWYCKAGKSLAFKEDPKPPPFADLPQHDWDHTGNGGYIQELEERLVAIVNAVSESKAKHEVEAQTLAGDLDALASEFKGMLKARGKRSGGTHAGWKMGRESVASKAAPAEPKMVKGVLSGRWYYPFSMASNAGVKGYPALKFDAESREKLEWLANKLKGLGSS